MINFQIAYAIPTGAKREYGIVKLPGGPTLPEYAVQEGWLKVREEAGKREEDEDALAMLENLRSLEAQAKDAGKGLWGSGVKAEASYELSDPKSMVEQLKGKKIDSIVEKVLSGDRMLVRLLISPERHIQTLVVVAGIRAPSTARTGPDGTVQAGEPFGTEAHQFVEARLLQRKVSVSLLGVTPQGQLVATVMHPKGNIANFLLEEGLARCSDHHSTLLGGDMAGLRQAEKKAKDAKKGVFTGRVAPKAAGAAETDYTVSRVMNADTIFIRNKAGAEKRVQLSSIRQPKPSDPKQSVFGNDAKEFLRKKIIGKHVKVTIDGKKPASEGYEEREVATVLQNGTNIALTLVEAGYASVIRHRRDDEDRSPEYDELLQAEEAAQKEAKGMWSPKAPAAKKYQDYSESVQKAKLEASVLQRQRKVPGVVDFVKSGSRFTILIPRDNAKLTLVLSGIRAPRSARNENETGEPFGQEAHEFANRRCMQRDVEIDVETIDKIGGFIGTLYVNRENFTKLLLEEGLAEVHDYSADQSGHGNEYRTAQQKAKEARKGMWHSWDPSQDIPEEEAEYVAPTNGSNGDAGAAPTKKDYRDVMVTNIDEAGKVKIQQVGTGTAALTELMNKFRTFHINKSNAAPLSGPPKAGDFVSAQFTEDNEWYRAKIRRNDRENKKCEVVYIDYGNSEVIPWSRLRELKSQFATSVLKGQAIDAQLSLIQLPVSPEYLKDTINLMSQATFDKQLIAIVDFVSPEGTLFVTLMEQNVTKIDQSINAEIIREGLAMVPKKLKAWERARADALKTLTEMQDEAKAERLGMWEYGDLTED